MAYEFWLDALAGRGPELSADSPQEGFYRIKSGKVWIPVALWWDGERDENDDPVGDQKLVCIVGFADTAQDRDPLEIFNQKSSTQMSVWLSAAKYPVSEENYRQAFDTGRWHDDAPELARGIGDNLPEEPVDQINVELDGEAEIVEKFLKEPVKTQAQADKVGPWVKRLRDLAHRADRIRADEKAPHLQAERDIDDKWRHPIAKAKELVKNLLGHLQPFLDEQDSIRREAARKAAEEEDRLRREAAQQKSQADREELERKASEAAKQAVVEKPRAGRTGATVSLRREKYAEIVNYDALLMALKDRPEVKEIVDTLAQRAARAGVEIDGMKIKERTKAV